LRIESDSHLHGEVIAEHAFPEEHDSLLGVLGGLDIPLRAAGPSPRLDDHSDRSGMLERSAAPRSHSSCQLIKQR
jgi:hypothetical protein